MYLTEKLEWYILTIDFLMWFAELLARKMYSVDGRLSSLLQVLNQVNEKIAMLHSFSTGGGEDTAPVIEKATTLDGAQQILDNMSDEVMQKQLVSFFSLFAFLFTCHKVGFIFKPLISIKFLEHI